MIFRRQKILLAVLEEFGGILSRTELQKYLFLFCERSNDRAYEFVPYKYGCFSFQTHADKKKLTEKNYLANKDQWELAGPRNSTGFRSMLNGAHRSLLSELREEFETASGNDLIRHIYTEYPYYAINSLIAPELLSPGELNLVETAKPNVAGSAIVSIGYEGLSLERYLNYLIRLDARLVCDVRKRPLSRKFGFSKTALGHALEQMGMAYAHYPELGISSDMRQNLNVQADYDRLLEKYEHEILAAQSRTVQELADHLGERQRIALICFERLPEQCHRTRVARAIMRRTNIDAEVWGREDARTYTGDG